MRMPHVPAPLRARLATVAVALAGLTFLSGCVTMAPTQRLHAAAPNQLPAIERTVAMPPDITLNLLSGGGVRELRDDWTESARASAREALAQIRPERIVYVGDLADHPEVREELEEVQALYRAVALDLAIFSRPPFSLPTIARRFDLSVGSVERILDATGGDALLVVFGMDDYFSGDRKAFVALGLIGAALTGAYVGPGSGVEHVSAALIARDGTILWYDYCGAGRIGDLRQPAGVRATLENLLKSMPQTGAAATTTTKTNTAVP